MGCHFLLQGIFPTQRSNLGLPHCRQILYHLSPQGYFIKKQINKLSPTRSYPRDLAENKIKYLSSGLDIQSRKQTSNKQVHTVFM